MVIFRENSEDIYAGIEYEAESDKAKKLINFLIKEMGVTKIRFPNTSGIGIKPVSRECTERLVRKAIQYAIDNDKPSVTIVHKGNIMKSTEVGFRDWAYGLAHTEFGAQRCLMVVPGAVSTTRALVVKSLSQTALPMRSWSQFCFVPLNTA